MSTTATGVPGSQGLTPAKWAAQLGPSWGPYPEANTVDLALHVQDKVIHHGAKSACTWLVSVYPA